MRTPARKPRITRTAQRASQREATTPAHWDDWVQCTEMFYWWLNKEQCVNVQCIKQMGHKGLEHKANVKGGVVKWKQSLAHAAEDKS